MWHYDTDLIQVDLDEFEAKGRNLDYGSNEEGYDENSKDIEIKENKPNKKIYHARNNTKGTKDIKIDFEFSTGATS